jgi:hypothetical protein
VKIVNCSWRPILVVVRSVPCASVWQSVLVTMVVMEVVLRVWLESRSDSATRKLHERTQMLS